jgi:hypothetical protein
MIFCPAMLMSIVDSFPRGLLNRVDKVVHKMLDKICSAGQPCERSGRDASFKIESSGENSWDIHAWKDYFSAWDLFIMYYESHDLMKLCRNFNIFQFLHFRRIVIIYVSTFPVLRCDGIWKKKNTTKLKFALQKIYFQLISNSCYTGFRRITHRTVNERMSIFQQ